MPCDDMDPLNQIYKHLGFFPLRFPCPCWIDTKDCKTWGCYICGKTIYLHTDGDLECKKCPKKSFMQNWLFQCIHKTGKDPEGEFIGIGSISEMFAAMS